MQTPQRTLSMPTDPPPISSQVPVLEMAHVLFMDLVEYSKLPMDEQRLFLRTLQETVSATSECVRAQATDQLLRLPTGDGMAVVFFGDLEAPARCAVELSRNLSKGFRDSAADGHTYGSCIRVKDINADRNVTGAASTWRSG